jgi:hypothetical protein
MHIIIPLSQVIPLSQHPNARESGLVVVWQDAETHNAVCAAGVGFIATIGNTGAAFAELFATKDAAVTAWRLRTKKPRAAPDKRAPPRPSRAGQAREVERFGGQSPLRW